jgi:imidazolonepropionase-like amidohydrolase
LTNASIIDVSDGTVMDRTCIIVAGGKIAELLIKEQAVGVGADRTMDLAGAFLTPGLINAHCHMTLPGAISTRAGLLAAYRRQIERGATECVRHGVTTVRDMMAFAAPMRSLKRKIARGGFVAPRIVNCCALDVRKGYTRMTAMLSDDEFWQPADYPLEAREAIQDAHARGASFIKLFQQTRQLTYPGRKLKVMDERTIRAPCEEAGKLGMPIAMHHTGAEGLERGLAGPVTSLEHMAHDRMLSDDEAAAAKGRFFVPTASVAFCLAYESADDPNWGRDPLPRMAEERKRIFPDLIREFSEPELVDGTLDLFNKLSNPAYFETKRMIPVPRVKAMTAAATTGRENMMKLRSAGAQFGCGNDGGVPLIFPGALAVEMTLMQESGFSPAEVLRAATLTNAKILGMDDKIGSIAAGKIADLAVFAKNPLEDARNANHPLLVLQNGVVTSGFGRP